MGRPDTGLFSYAAALGVVLIPAYLLNKANMQLASKSYFVGAGAGLVWRLIDQLTGQQYVSLDNGLGSFLIPGNPPLPGPNVFPAGGRSMLPAPSAVSTAGKANATSPMQASNPTNAGMSYLVHAA
jgi:hypothetical protein